MPVPWRFDLGSWLVRGLVLVAALAVVGGMNMVPAQADDFASVTVTFTNTGSLPLYKRFHKLDHGCWATEPPLTIPALSTVTWKSVSCGVFTGTEGSVLYQPHGAPDGINGRFYWDDPATGDNTAENAAPSGCRSSQTNPPPDGLTFEIFFTMGCNASSGDGIADVWKLNKFADPGGGAAKQIVDLAAMGAAVGQKDIFVQLDWMQDATHNQQLDPATIRRLVNTFAANGFSLHIDAGPNSILNFNTNTTWGPLSRARSTGYQPNLGTGTVDAAGNVNYDWTAFNAIKAANFVPTGRVEIFHYALAARQIANFTSVSGGSGPGGVGIIIGLGNFTGGVGSVDEQTGTLMHELGHDLGLDHGGRGDPVNFKPNYFSVMNYAFGMRGFIRNGQRVYDYSHGGQRDLVESGPYGLDESAGLGPNAAGFQTQHFCPAKGSQPARRIAVADAAGPIDWDCDGVFNEPNVLADVNADPKQPMNTLGTLVDHDDWSDLTLVGGAIGSFGASIPEPPIVSTLDDAIPEAPTLDTTAPVTSAQPSPTANQAGWNNADVTVTISASDDSSGVARTEYNLDDSGWTLYSTPLVISTDAVHTLRYRSTDQSSNVETAKNLTVKLDKTPPTVSYTGNAGTYGILDTVNITCTSADNLSGVATSTCQNINGPAYDLSLGSTTLSATANDVAGNTGQGSTSFTLKVTFDDMCTLSRRFVTNSGFALATAMCVQLDAAELAQAQGNQTAKAAAINAYLTTVDTAVIGRFLSPGNAAILKKLSAGL